MRKFLIIVAASSVLGWALLSFEGAAQTRAPETEADLRLSYAPVVRQTAPAVVNIYTKTVVERRGGGLFAGDPFFERLFRDRMPRKRLESSLGSGVIVAPDGLVVTNAHVIKNAVEIRVVLSDRREYSAEVVLSDAHSDLAILRLEGAEGLPALPFGDSDALEVGDLVLAIGNPFGVGQTVTSGIISAELRTGADGRTFIQTDAAINPGNSGGALVDMSGRLVGVNTAILTRSGGSHGIGFAIPVGLAAQAVAQAEAGADHLMRAWLGAEGQIVDAAIAQSIGLEAPQGVILRAVAPESTLGEAGLRPGDVILGVDGWPIDDMAGLEFRAALKPLGEDIALEVMRDGALEQISAELISAPETPPRNALTLRGEISLDGARVANLNPALALELGLPVAARGVIVLDVEGRARQYNLRKGDIIRGYNSREIEKVGDLIEAIDAEPRTRALRLQRGNRRISLRFG